MGVNHQSKINFGCNKMFNRQEIKKRHFFSSFKCLIVNVQRTNEHVVLLTKVFVHKKSKYIPLKIPNVARATGRDALDQHRRYAVVSSALEVCQPESQRFPIPTQIIPFPNQKLSKIRTWPDLTWLVGCVWQGQAQSTTHRPSFQLLALQANGPISSNHDWGIFRLWIVS